jgi:hypothetical protein
MRVPVRCEYPANDHLGRMARKVVSLRCPCVFGTPERLARLLRWCRASGKRVLFGLISKEDAIQSCQHEP